MTKTLIGLTWLLVSTFAIAQTNPEKYAATITEASLEKQLSIIAGPEMEGRETATEGQRKAAAYIINQYQQAGLLTAPGTTNYLQEFPLFIDSVTKTELIVKGKRMQFGKDFLTPVQTNDNNSLRARRFVFAGYGISDSTYDDYAGKDVKGKVVVIFAGEPRKGETYLLSGTNKPGRWSGSNAKVALAKQKGAVALVTITSGTEEYTPAMAEAVTKTNLYYPKPAGSTTEGLSMINISHAAAERLIGANRFSSLLTRAKAYEPLNDVDVAFRSRLRLKYIEEKLPRFSTNVVGYIEGTDKKDEYVVLTGHYDHLGRRGDVIYYGADDDGSGTVSVLEMAHAFSKAKAEGNGPRRSVVFMTVSGEEKGLLGSQYYSENPLFPLNKTSVNLNTDMVGRIDPSRKYGDSMNYVYVIGEDKLSSDLPKITDEANSKYVNLELDRKYNANDPNRFYFRSDHYNFARKGVPIIFYFNGTHADYHRPTDTVDKINFDLMTKRVHLVFHTAWIMANRNDMLKRDIPLK